MSFNVAKMNSRLLTTIMMMVQIKLLHLIINLKYSTKPFKNSKIKIIIGAKLKIMQINLSESNRRVCLHLRSLNNFNLKKD